MMGATATDYKNFHNMLISPWRAQRCIRDLNGVVIFMPTEGTEGFFEGSFIFADSSSMHTDKTTGNLRRLAQYEGQYLNLLTYYLLVLVSFTGLSSLLGLTELIDFQENKDGLKEPEKEYDVDTQSIQRYLMLRTNAKSVKRIRRYEFDFKLPGIQVVMIHYLSEEENLLHLVEVYNLSERMNFIVRILNFLTPFLSSRRKPKKP